MFQELYGIFKIKFVFHSFTVTLNRLLVQTESIGN